MTCYDEQLRQLQIQMARARQLEAMLQELHGQRDALSEQVRDLETVKLEEQADVDRLEGRSLAAFFYAVIEKLDEHLDQERREAYAARVKYDAAARELDGVDRDLLRCESELLSLQGCESRYEAALKEKAAAVKAAGGRDGAEILRLEERAAFLESQGKELGDLGGQCRPGHHTAGAFQPGQRGGLGNLGSARRRPDCRPGKAQPSGRGPGHGRAPAIPAAQVQNRACGRDNPGGYAGQCGRFSAVRGLFF